MNLNSARSQWWIGLVLSVLAGALIGALVGLYMSHLSIAWVW